MSEPDEAMVEAVAQVIRGCDQACCAEVPLDMRLARAVLSVPVVRDALARDAQAGCHAITDDDGTTYCPLAEANMRAVARDAQVAREVGTPDDRMWMSPGECAESFHDIAALYPSPGDRDDSEEQRRSAVWEMKPDGRVMVDGHPTGASAELLEAVARAIHDRDCVEIVACKTPARRYHDLASAVLAVPAVAGLVEMNALLSEEVASLSTLPDDWDGYGAATISDAALAVVRALHVVPTVNGGVQIEWHANGWDVEVEVSKDGIPIVMLMEAT